MAETSLDIRRPSLGQVADLGAIYDAQTDSFQSQSVLLCTYVPNELINEVEMRTSNIDYTREESVQEKFERLNVNAELGASFLSGMVSVEGSGSYLSDSPSSSSSMQASYFYDVTTKKQSLNFSAFTLPEYRGYMNFNQVNRLASSCQYVVAAIEWGAKSVVTVKYDMSKGDNTMDVDLTFKAGFSKLKEISVNGGGKTKIANKETIMHSNFEFKICGDLETPEIPSSFDEVYNYVKKLPENLSKANGGKGRPMIYILHPIASLAKVLELDIGQEVFLRQLDLECLSKFVQLFEEWRKNTQKLKDHYSGLKDHSNYIPQGYIEEVERGISRMRAKEARLEQAYRNILKKVRVGEAETSCLGDLFNEFSDEENHPKYFLSVISSIYQERVDFANSMIAQGCSKIISEQGELRKILRENKDKDIYVWNIRNVTSPTSRTIFEENHELVTDLLKSKEENYILAIFYCDSETDSAEGLSIEHYRANRGKALKNQNRLRDKSCIRYAGGSRERLKPRFLPETMALFIPCPGDNCNQRESRNWYCEICDEIIGFREADGYCYCTCSRAKYDACKFKCCDEQHGLSYSSYDSEILVSILWGSIEDDSDEMPRAEDWDDVFTPANGNTAQQLQSIELEQYEFGVKNIVVMGESEKDRRFLINSVVNYLRYSRLSFDEAAHESVQFDYICDSEIEYKCLDSQDRPCEFKQMCSRTIDSPSISESFPDFRMRLNDEKAILRFIESPLSKNEERPGKTFFAALKANKIEQIHAIIILLDPSKNELEAGIGSAVQNFLSDLHNDALDNIFFCFNTEQSLEGLEDNYEPLINQKVHSLFGKSGSCHLASHDLVTLKFNSRGFKELALIKKIGALSESKSRHRMCSNSWETSVETVYFLGYQLTYGRPFQISTSELLHQTRAAIPKIAQTFERRSLIPSAIDEDLDIWAKFTVLNQWSSIFVGESNIDLRKSLVDSLRDAHIISMAELKIKAVRVRYKMYYNDLSGRESLRKDVQDIYTRLQSKYGWELSTK